MRQMGCPKGLPFRKIRRGKHVIFTSWIAHFMAAMHIYISQDTGKNLSPHFAVAWPLYRYPITNHNVPRYSALP